MLRSARLVVLTLLLSSVVGSLGAGTASAAVAVPAITKLTPPRGPLAVSTVVLNGRHLAGADAVEFGTRRGRIVRRTSATSITVRTPQGVRAGTVPVRVHTRGGWSKPAAAARYTFVPAPSVTRVSPATGEFVGGQRVTLSGTNLQATGEVLFGTARARVLSRSARAVVVLTPVGVLGATQVKVTTPGGTTRPASYTYTAPPAQASQTVTPEDGAFVPAEVQWVTGGPDGTTSLAPWVVSLPPRAAAPTVGATLVVPPGRPVFPSGLAGTVSEVATQADESTRVTVRPVDLQEAFEDLRLDYAGPLGPERATPSSSNRTPSSSDRRAAEVSGNIEWAVGPTALVCRDQQDNSTVAVGGSLAMRVTDVDVSQHLKAGRLNPRPTYDAAVTAEVETTGTISAEVAVTCRLKEAWTNAQRRVVPLGTTGLTVSFGPAIEVSVSSKGSIKVINRTRTTFAVVSELGKTPQFSRTSRNVQSDFGGSLSLEASLSGGVSLQFGLLDRAGLEGKMLLGVSASVEASASTGAATNVCITAKLFMQVSVGLFLDAWVARWESPTLTGKIELSPFPQKCVVAEPEPGKEPEIATTRLPDAEVGKAYAAALETVDRRAGTWSIVRYALPAGLALDGATGRVQGTPTGAVGDYPVIVDFKDAQGKLATTTVRLRLQPQAGIRGGDLQVTLKWSGPADLDLHVVDPSSEEIFYRNRTSESGGTLDKDANRACNGVEDDDNAVENVFWPAQQAPAGAYKARVQVYATCGGPVDWQLVVRRNGVVILDERGTGTSPDFGFSLGATTSSRTTTSPARLTAREPKA